MSSLSAPFRFRDLPKEIRDKIYCELLCDFKPRLTTRQPSELLESTMPAPHNIDTAILRTSAAVYREAYDVMVKTNRFVKVTSVRGLPTHLLLNGIQVPVVASSKNVVDSFGGYVLAVHLGTTRTLFQPQEPEYSGLADARTLMILHRDMDAFCHALMDGDAYSPGFTDAVQINITVAPILAVSRPTRHLPSFADFFSDTTQKTLLAPFRATLRGYKSVKIQGHVDQDLARAVEANINEDRWFDPGQVVADFAAAKEEGSTLFRQRKTEDACLAWQDAAVDIDKMVESSSWSTLAERGGEQFIFELAELYFLVRLNSAHVQLTILQASGTMPPYYVGMMVEDNLKSAVRSLKKDHWMEGYKYRPTLKHLAKLRYRYALLMRLQDEPGTAGRALTYINKALQSQPGDSVIMRERDNIVAWMQRSY
jgi:hypothetical protein